ncbi:MAG: phage terminase large subunit [Candidatus Binatus sp.]
MLIEDAASGQSLIQALKAETRLPILPVKPLGDKVSRAHAVSPLVESGRVFVPAEASWLADFIDEATSFPAAPHDDQVDAITQALNYLRGEGHGEYHFISLRECEAAAAGGQNYSTLGRQQRIDRLEDGRLARQRARRGRFAGVW